MIWSTECSRVRERLPLVPGGDLPPAEQAVVERHLLQCLECRQELSDAEAAQAVLAEARTRNLQDVSAGESLWPAVERQLTLAMRPAPSPSGWIPVGALAAACAALLMVGLFGPSFQPSTESSVADGSSYPIDTYVNRVGFGTTNSRPARSLPYLDTESY